ncbi:MAG: M12 family metallo-peptidase, partial [bacterium]
HPDGSSASGAYTVGYALPSSGYSHTLTVNTDGSGLAQATFQISRYGGDNYTFSASADAAGNGGTPASGASPQITVWRRYLVPVYSMKNAAGTDNWFYKPDTSLANSYLAASYIEMQAVDTGFGGMVFLSPLSASVSAQFSYVETASNYASASEAYSQKTHGQACVGIDRYSSSGTIGLWTGSYNPGNIPPPGVNVNQKPYNTRNYFTVAHGRMLDFWSGSTMTSMEAHVLVHEFGHSLGLPHNNDATTGNPPLSKHGANGIGIMAPATGPGVEHLFTDTELQFLRGADQVSGQTFRGPYYE